MAEETKQQTKDDLFRERLVMVEQQQKYQKEVLMEVNETLKEVVKTQYVLASQREELDLLKKDNALAHKKLHEYEIERAASKSKIEQYRKEHDALKSTLYDEVLPYQNKQKTYIRLVYVIGGLLWSAMLAYLKVYSS